MRCNTGAYWIKLASLLSQACKAARSMPAGPSLQVFQTEIARLLDSACKPDGPSFQVFWIKLASLLDLVLKPAGSRLQAVVPSLQA